jgi:hypothetical protein
MQKGKSADKNEDKTDKKPFQGRKAHTLCSVLDFSKIVNANLYHFALGAFSYYFLPKDESVKADAMSEGSYYFYLFLCPAKEIDMKEKPPCG